jgi:hypothetical protein
MTVAIEKPVQLCLFDWDKLDTKTRQTVQEADEKLNHHAVKACEHYIEACKALKAIYDTLQTKSPDFWDYCKDKQISASTARNMLKIAKLPELPELPFNVTALNWLTKQPEEKRERLIEALNSQYTQETDENKRISKEMLKELDQQLTEEWLTPQWEEIDINSISWSKQETKTYRGWEISSGTTNGGILGIIVNNSKKAYIASIANLDLDLLLDQDWCIGQAKKEIDRLEKSHRRPDTLNCWGFDTEEIGSFIEKYQGNDILLIKDGNGLIYGCQIRLGDRDYSNLLDGEFGLNLTDWPQAHRDPDWWIAEAKKCDFSEDDDDDDPAFTEYIVEDEEVEEFNEPHPDYTGEKWEVNQKVEVNGIIGKIKSLHPHGAIVIFPDKNELIPYDSLKKHQPEPVPKSEINLIPVEILGKVKKILGEFAVIETLSEDWGKDGENLLVIPSHEQVINFLKKLQTSYALCEVIAIFPIDINAILTINSGNICYLRNPINDTYYLVWYLGIYPDVFAKSFKDLGTIWDSH